MQRVSLDSQILLKEFLAQEQIAVLSLPINSKGKLHSAALLYYHTESPLAFYFVTGRKTEKVRLLLESDSLPASCVIGMAKGIAFTIQMRGEIRIAELDTQTEAALYVKRGNRKDDLVDPDNICLQFTPSWVRFTDYPNGRERKMLEL